MCFSFGVWHENTFQEITKYIISLDYSQILNLLIITAIYINSLLYVSVVIKNNVEKFKELYFL